MLLESNADVAVNCIWRIHPFQFPLGELALINTTFLKKQVAMEVIPRLCHDTLLFGLLSARLERVAGGVSD
jgi:hypothetical protein